MPCPSLGQCVSGNGLGGGLTLPYYQYLCDPRKQAVAEWYRMLDNYQRMQVGLVMSQQDFRLLSGFYAWRRYIGGPGAEV